MEAKWYGRTCCIWEMQVFQQGKLLAFCMMDALIFFRFNVLHPKYRVSICTVKTTYALIDLSSIEERVDSIYMIYEAKLNSIVSRKCNVFKLYF